MKDFKPVSKDEFDQFLRDYPRKLERDVYGACEPPLVTFNDFDRAPYWPDSVVARCCLDSGVLRDFYVIADINAPVKDDYKRDTDTPIHDKDGNIIREGDLVRLHWGGSLTMGGEWTDNFREHTVILRDKGTKYERLSLHDCHNDLRSWEGQAQIVLPAALNKAGK